jgi:hypothetical protein
MLIHMVYVSVYAQQKIHVTGMVKDDKGAPSAKFFGNSERHQHRCYHGC